MPYSHMLKVLLIALSIFMIGCAENITESTPSLLDNSNNGQPFSFTDVQAVFTASCALSGCHGGNVNPNLSSGQAYGNIVGIASSQGDDYIVSGNSQGSYLFRKIVGGPNINGLRMPRTGPPYLNQSVIDSIGAWIDRGAAR